MAHAILQAARKQHVSSPHTNNTSIDDFVHAHAGRNNLGSVLVKNHDHVLIFARLGNHVLEQACISVIDGIDT